MEYADQTNGLWPEIEEYIFIGNYHVYGKPAHTEGWWGGTLFGANQIW